MNDVRYALRTLARQPSFTIAAVATLALGIAVNTIAFSLIDSLMLRPIPVPDAARVVRAYPVEADGHRDTAFSYADYLDYRQADTPFETLVGYIPAEMTAGRSTLDRDGVEPRAVLGYVVSSNYFELTGVRASLGRVLGAADDRPGSQAVVLAHSFWRSRFGADPAAIGATLVLNGTPFTVVGVAADRFAGTEPLVADCWIPLPQLPITIGDAHNALDRNAASLLVAGRLRPGATRAGAAESLTLEARRLAAAYPGRSRPMSVEIAAGTFFTIDPGLKPLIAGVMAVVGLVLFIACANATNLALARAASRRREIAVRLAIGASRLHIVRQLLVESALVGLAAGVAALLLSGWTLRGLYRLGISLAALPWAITLNLEPDVRVYAWTSAIALLSGAALGLLPALQFSSPRIAAALHGGGVFAGRLRGTTMRHALVVSQVAASLVLLFGAGLLLRALASAEALDLGFKAAGVIYADYDPRSARFTPARAEAFNAALLEAARALPGVTATAMTSHVPLHGGVRREAVRVAGSSAGVTDPQAIVSSVSADYFAALQIPVLAGRTFGAQDTSRSSIIISEGLARRFWPDALPIGNAILLPDSPAPRTVIGIVHDATNGAIWRDKELAVYLPVDAVTDPLDLRMLIRTTADPIAVSRLLTERATSLAGNLRFAPVLLDTLLRLWLLPSKVAAASVGVLAAMALALACIGLYGVLTFAVSERSRELGIRMALGADAAAVIRLILGDAWRLVAGGLVIGATLALPATPLLGRLLFGVSPFDPVTLTAAAASLTAVALAAAYRPARRASRLEPLTVLRME